jgi:hypothetical protein
MSYGTAERKLRKAVIYELARQTGKNVCIDCGREINSPEDLALVHVEGWQENPDQFFELTNVAFSHASCKASRGGRGQEEEKEMRRVEVTVEDAQGRALPGVSHRGAVYVAGEKDRRYQIRVRNTTNRRLLVVTTVDGRNVITGKPGDVNGSGHVLDPWQEWTFEGWRQNDDRVAAFRFGAKKEAYSSQMGSPENVGVIGVAVFEEQEPERRIVTIREREYVPYPVVPCPLVVPLPWVQPDWSISNSGGGGGGTFTSTGTFTSSGTVESCGGAGSSVDVSGGTGMESSDRFDLRLKTQQLGTEYGESVVSQVRNTSFKRASDDPAEIHEFRYDSMKALRARGIMGRRPSQKRRRAPQAFPRNPEVQGGYCPPPPRRRAYKT